MSFKKWLDNNKDGFGELLWSQWIKVIKLILVFLLLCLAIAFYQK
ncbi:MAG: hypothetical protein NTX36_04010 [Proteobacteria bacterium]|nr:hypothetical protein [Pseudomonadota bacterium]